MDGVPSHRIWPASARTIPRQTRIVVVLPAPFAPRKPNTSPLRDLERQPVEGERRPEALGDVVDGQAHPREDIPERHAIQVLPVTVRTVSATSAGMRAMTTTIPQSVRSSGVAWNALASNGTYGIAAWIATTRDAGHQQEPVHRQPMNGLPDAPVRVGTDRLRADQARVRQPADVLEGSRVGDHHDERGDRAIGPRNNDPAQDVVGQQRDATWPWGTTHQVGLGLLELECDRGGDVDEQLHPQDLERKQGLAEPVQGRDEDEPEERHVGRDQEDQPLLDVVDDPPALAEAVHQGGERVVAEDQVGRLLGDAGPRPHRDRDVRVMERRRVVHTVSGHGHGVSEGARHAHEALLLVGGRSRHDLEPRQLRGQALVAPAAELLADDDPLAVEACLAGDRRRRQRMVPGHDDDLDAGDPGSVERFRDAVAKRVGEADDRLDRPGGRIRPASDRHEPLPGGGPSLGQPVPGGKLGGAGIGEGEDRFGRTDRELLAARRRAPDGP